MTGCDTGEQLAGLSTKLSRSRAAHFSGCHSQKYTQCIINVLFCGVLQGLNGVYFRQYSIIINFVLRRTVFPPFYVKGIEASKASAGGLEADSYGNGSKSTERRRVAAPGPGGRSLEICWLKRQASQFDAWHGHSRVGEPWRKLLFRPQFLDL